MSELKFSCGHCAQHINADAAWAGHQIKCPNCQGDLVIPSPLVANAPKPVSAAVPPPLAPAVPPPTAAPRAQAVPSAPMPVKLWLLALAPLPLLLIGFVVMGAGVMLAKSWYGALAGLFFLVPSALCAHAAVNEKNSNRAISGTQAAGIAAVIAYVGMVLTYLMIVGIIFRTAQFTYYRMTGQITTQPKSSPFMSGRSYDTSPFNSAPATSATQKTSTAPAKPAEPPVTTDLKTVTIPDAVPSGTLFDAPFTCTAIQYNSIMNTLEISQGTAPHPQANIKMIMFLKNKSLAGQSIVIGPGFTVGGPNAHIYLTGNNSKSEVLSSGYAMRLEFGQPEKGVLTGHIYLEAPKSYGTKISGTFKIPAQ